MRSEYKTDNDFDTNTDTNTDSDTVADINTDTDTDTDTDTFYTTSGSFDAASRSRRPDPFPMTLVAEIEDQQPIRVAASGGEGCRPRTEPGSPKVEDELQNLGTEAIEQLASGLNKAAITIQELGQNVRLVKHHLNPTTLLAGALSCTYQIGTKRESTLSKY